MVLHLSRDHLIKRSLDFKIGVPPIGSYYSANVGGHRYWERADISFLNLSRDHVIKRSRDFEGGVPPLQITSLSSLVVIGVAEGQI